MVLIILTILVAINAFYVAAEFAAISVSRPRIQQLVDEGSATAVRLLPIISDTIFLDRFVAACQIGITLSSLILGAYGQFALTQYFDQSHGFSFALVLISLTAFQMILGELLPKSLALQFPTKTLLLVTSLMIFSLKIFYPFIQFLNGSGTLFLKIFGIPQTSHRHVHTAAEMKLLFSESHEGGMLETVEQERLEQALELVNRQVSEIMVPKKDIKALEVHATYAEILQAMGTAPFTRWPVYDGEINRIIGIVHARDIARLAMDSTKKFDLKKVIREPLVVHTGMTADHLLGIMRIEHKQLAIVVDQFGTNVGLVGISDVLDELMGDIQERSSPGGRA